MARQARLRSTSGIYHVMLRGNNREKLFLDAPDFEKMMLILKDCTERDGDEISPELYAFCLMDNHVHLLVKAPGDELSAYMKSITLRYVQYYKRKYEHVGHLFQDRFKSLPVEDETYLMAVYRYIAGNPVKAKLCDKVTDYAYSSFNRRFEWLAPLPVSFTPEQIKEFVITASTGDDYLFENASDNEVKELFLGICEINRTSEFAEKSKAEQNKLLLLLQQRGFSLRQLADLTGISKSTLARRIY